MRVVSFNDTKPFDKKESRRLWVAILIPSFILLLIIPTQPSLDSPLFIVVLIAGIVLWFALAALIGDLCHRYLPWWKN